MRYLFFLSALFISIVSTGQRSDFIVLKKKNNRTLKTYFNGSFISATTYNGFVLNGMIKEIRNDTLFVEQQNVYQVPTQFGVPALDTLIYTVPVDYRDLRRFDYSRKTGFLEISLPRIMTLGGLGYLVLESVNTLYRKESFNDRSKLIGMGVAAGVAGAGLLLKRLHDNSKEAGGKFKVVYVKMN